MFNKTKEELGKKMDKEKPQIETLMEDELDQVNGAGNPFKKIPRVPTAPIDDELHNDA